MNSALWTKVQHWEDEVDGPAWTFMRSTRGGTVYVTFGLCGSPHGESVVLVQNGREKPVRSPSAIASARKALQDHAYIDAT